MSIFWHFNYITTYLVNIFKNTLYQFERNKYVYEVRK